jgi:ABC-type multidrug transport system fused ATPase/permease subunit
MRVNDEDMELDKDEDREEVSSRFVSRLEEPDKCGDLFQGVRVFQGIRALWSMITFGWVKPLLELGNQRPLQLADLGHVHTQDSADYIFTSFQRVWQQQRNVRQRPLFRSFAIAFGGPFAAAGGIKFVHDCLLFVAPQLLKKIINLLSDPQASMPTALSLVAGLFFTNFVMSLCLRQYFWWCYLVGMRLRSAVVTSVYQKSLKLSTAARRRRTAGEITNLMSVDSQRLQDLTPYLHAIWYSFLQIGLALYFLWMVSVTDLTFKILKDLHLQELGPSCLAGIVFIAATIPLSGSIAKRMKNLQSRLMAQKDERVKLNVEVLSGMKVIKLQAWEPSYINRLNELRDMELVEFRVYLIVKSFSGALWSSTPLFVALVTFTVYIALGNKLDVAAALTSLALFDILRFPLMMLPQVVNNIIEARVSIRRVEDFLLDEERSPHTTTFSSTKGVLIQKASFTWDALRFQNNAQWVKDEMFSDNSSKNNRAPISRSMWCSWSWARSRRYSLLEEQSLANSPRHVEAEIELNDEQWERVLLKAQLAKCDLYIDQLEQQLVPAATRTAGSNGPHNFAASDTVDANNGTAAISPRGDGRSALMKLVTLHRLNLGVYPGEIVAVVGVVGSGKSSLISSLLGDLRMLSGDIACAGRIAYVAQIPFIQNATLQENICFGLPFDQALYEHTLKICALLPDLKVLPAGDRTEIGEKGINLVS